MKKLVHEIKNTGKSVRIVFDYSNLMYRVSMGFHKQLAASAYQDWSVFKHYVISNILDMQTKFPKAEIILAFDEKLNGKYWRHRIFKDYKGTRKNRVSKIPKSDLHREFAALSKEIQENMPWKQICIPGIEADDIIATIARRYASDITVIVSPDHDFEQLLINPNVFLVDMKTQNFRTSPDPIKAKFIHILKGDKGDGIPNIYSDPDTFMNKLKKQTVFKTTLVNEMYYVFQEEGLEAVRDKYLTDPIIQKRYVQNRQLVDLTMLPSIVESKIIHEYNNRKVSGGSNKFFQYCISNGLTELSKRAQELRNTVRFESDD